MNRVTVNVAGETVERVRLCEFTEAKNQSV